MEIQKNFIGSRMNKDLDERLLPKGEYKDALNIEITQDAQGEAGSAKNTLGNTEVVSLSFDGQPLSSEAKTIGSFEDGANETLYWFTTDPTRDVDIISSFNFRDNTLIYHYVGDLGFDKDYRVNDVDLIDDLLFFNDNLNPPRRINVNRTYSGNSADELNVVVAPPSKAPIIDLVKTPLDENYIKDKFISFAYRYRYKDGEYSSLSEFSKYAFSTSNFKVDYATYQMTGMENAFNAVDVTFNTGSKDVVAIDLCFKLSDQNIVNVIERFYKKEKFFLDNEEQTIRFNNKKIYTTLTQDQLLRRFDNVPRKAKTQCRMGNRLFYGNTLEGYDIDTTINTTYEVVSEDPGFQEVESDSTVGQGYGISDGRSIPNSTINIDLNDKELKKGTTLFINFDVTHSEFSGDTYEGPENSFNVNYAFNLKKDYLSPSGLFNDQDFKDSIQSQLNIEDCSLGYSLTDIITCNILTENNWQISDRGVSESSQSAQISIDNGVIKIQLPSFEYEEFDTQDPPQSLGNFAYEYFSASGIDVFLLEEGSNESLHSDRDFELAMEYQDEYKRSTTALVNTNNTVYVTPDKSINKNFVKATVPHNPPSWAKYFRFLIKPSKGSYDTVYSNIYFQDQKTGFFWFKLEGENINKVKEGDVLYVKSDSNGATQSRVKTSVLEIKTNESNFIEGNTTEDTGEEIIEPTGVYMRISPSGINISTDDNSFVTYGQVAARSDSFSVAPIFSFGLGLGLGANVLINSNSGAPGLTYPLFYNQDDGSGGVESVTYDVPAGSRIRIYFRDTRGGRGSGCGSRNYVFDKDFISTQDYNSFQDWFRGDNIDISEPSNNPQVESSDDSKPTANFIEAEGTDIPSYSASVTNVQFIEIDGLPYLAFKSGNKKCNGRRGKIYVIIEVQRAGGLVSFETEPQEVDGETFFEGSQSFEIVDGNHTGNIQNQTNNQPAIIDLDFFDCYTFGNGVESVKIYDSMVQPSLQLGERVSAVSQEEYKEIRRNTNISYSGIYNIETNLNKLNEFNLGLANFKVLEQLYGDLNVLHPYQTDILAIQEDKVSYVLTGKNLLTDAVGGSTISSVPEVLGTQVARSEEFGISHNSESFDSYGPFKFFSDAKRNSIVSLIGNSRGSDQMEVVSNNGMRTWFRDLFKNSFNTEKLGSYNPFSQVYTLSSNENVLPVMVNDISCGRTVSQIASNETIQYNIQFSDIYGEASIDYDFSSGSADLEVIYNNEVVINQNISGQGSVVFDKDSINISEALVKVVPSNATYSITFNCVDEVPLTVIKAILNSSSSSGQTITSSYTWTDNGYQSPEYLSDLGLEQDGVSLYTLTEGNESQGFIPKDGALIKMKSEKTSLNTFDNSSASFKYLVSDVLYTEEELLAVSFNEVSDLDVSDGLVEGEFIYNNPDDKKYLYIIWDYKIPSIGCNESLSATGSDGVYELDLSLGLDTGPVTVEFDSFNVPDRFQIEYDGQIVADSLFVGDNISNTSRGEILQASVLDRLVFDGETFVNNGTVSVDFGNNDIAIDDGTELRSSGSGTGQIGVVADFPTPSSLASNGNVKLTFNKTKTIPQTAKIIVTGVSSSTGWNLVNVDCPSSEAELQFFDDELWTVLEDGDLRPLPVGQSRVIVFRVTSLASAPEAEGYYLYVGSLSAFNNEFGSEVNLLSPSLYSSDTFEGLTTQFRQIYSNDTSATVDTSTIASIESSNYNFVYNV